MVMVCVKTLLMRLLISTTDNLKFEQKQERKALLLQFIHHMILHRHVNIMLVNHGLFISFQIYMLKYSKKIHLL